MASAITLQQLENASLDAESLETFASDPAPKDVKTRQGAVYPNLVKLTKTLIEKGLFNAYSFATLDDLKSSPPKDDSWLGDGAWAIVVSDPDPLKNGNYQKQGGEWVYSKFNPSVQIAEAINQAYAQFYNAFIPKNYASIDNVIFAVTDNNGNQTWLQVSQEDGGLTDVTEAFIRDKLKLRNTDDGSELKFYTNANTETWLQSKSDGGLTAKARERIGDELGIKYQSNTVMFAVTDNDGNRTWLEADNDGNPTEVSELAIREKINYLQTENPLALLTVTDKDGNLTDLWLDSTGQIADDVLKNWNNRLKALNANDLLDVPEANDHVINLKHSLPKIIANDAVISRHDVYFNNGELLPILPDLDKVILLGSSSLDNANDEIFPELQKLNPSMQMYNAAFGGSTINQMSAMYGSIPLKLKFDNNTINSNGNSNATIQNNVWFVRAHMAGMTGWVDGVHGTLNGTAQDGYAVVFTRTAVGAPVTLSGHVDFIPERGNAYRNALPIIWAGKNNLTNSSDAVNDVNLVIKETDAMLAYNASFVKSPIIITQFSNSYEAAVSPQRDRINRINQLYKLRYRDCVFDINEIILSKQIWTDLGLTKTDADKQELALSNLAPSLAIDAQHFTQAVNLYVAKKLSDFIKAKSIY